MGASITSESAAAGSHAPGSLMPPPATITGRSLDSMRRTAAASAAGSGAGELWLRYRSGLRVATTGVWADSTSRGRLMCTGPLRGASATRCASWMNSCTRSADGTLQVFLVTGVKSACWSTSWNASRWTCPLDNMPASAITAEYAAFACANPVTRFVAPGPFCPAKTTPACPDARA